MVLEVHVVPLRLAGAPYRKVGCEYEALSPPGLEFQRVPPHPTDLQVTDHK